MTDEQHVHGVVSDADGREVADAEVMVWRQLIRDRIAVASATSDEHGGYDAKFEIAQDPPGPALIAVEARSARFRHPVASGLLAAGPDLTVDLAESPADASEFGVLSRAVQAHIGRLALTDIVEDDEHRDISFLAQQVGRSREQITRLVISARLSTRYDVPAAAFYAFLTQHVPAALPDILMNTAGNDVTPIDTLAEQVAALIFAVPLDTQSATLSRAIDDSVIDASLRADIGRITHELRSHHVTTALDQPYLAGSASLSDLLTAARLPAAKHAVFAQALADSADSLQTFWQTLADGQHGLTRSQAVAVQRTLELGALVDNHMPLIQLLQGRFASGQLKVPADLARLTLSDWTSLIRQADSPQTTEPTGDLSAAEVYARTVYRRVTSTYPTAALASRVTSATLVPKALQQSVSRFFANNSSLDLLTTSLTAYLEQQPGAAYKGIPATQRAAVLDATKRFQRVLRVAPHVDAAAALLAAGFGSATEIYACGQQQFLARAATAGLADVEANQAYAAASQQYAAVISTLTRFRRDILGVWPAAIGSIDDLDDPINAVLQRDDSLATLFGSLDYCAVDDCTSVLSPAAYLCDLLLWLRGRTLTGDYAHALAAVSARRPDLVHLLLNCPNTDVALVYIDLVNELLEDAVAPPAVPAWRQTTRTEAELRAAPEHTENVAAYAILGSAEYPHTLPYHKPLDELRGYLSQSGISLWQLRRALLPVDGGTLDARTAAAAERFQIDPQTQVLITTANSVPAFTAWNTAVREELAPTTELVPVPAFLQAASITYDQLLELIELVWTRADAAPLTISGINDSCDISVETLSPAPLDPVVLDRMHRFLRLWRHTPWQLWELDALVRAPSVGAGTLDDALLVALSTVRSLLELTGLQVDQQLTYFGDIDATPGGHRNPDGTRTPSLYERTFLDPAIPTDADLRALLSGDAVIAPNLTDHLPALQAALQVSATEAALLFAAPVTDGQLSLASLSQLYRVVSLSRAIGGTVADLLDLVALSTAGSLDAAFADPAATRAFLGDVDAMRHSGFTTAEIGYLLTPTTTTTVLPDDTVRDVILTPVRAAIQRTHDEIFTTADPPLTVLGHELAQLPDFSDPAVVATALAIVDDAYAQPVAERDAFVAERFGVFMDGPTAQALLAPLVAGLTPAQTQAAIDSRAQAVLAPLATYLTHNRVIAALAPGVQIAADVCALLARELTLPGATISLLTVLTDPHLIDTAGGTPLPLSRAQFGDAYSAVDLVAKAATVVVRLHLVLTDLTWLLDNADRYGGLDLKHLPIAPGQPDLPLATLLTTALLVKLERSCAAAPATAIIPDLYSFIAGVGAATIGSAAQAQAALAAITGSRTTDIAVLAAALGLVFPADYTRPAAIDALRTLAAMVLATNGDAAQLVAWGAPDPSEDVAMSARAALQGRLSEPDWLALAPSIMDPIREHRSAALQAYLMAQRDATGAFLHGDADALFDHFLIDVQMSACQTTTRIVQAYSSVQLFVERCLMGLEGDAGVVVDVTRDDGWSQWSWMSRYRRWEANREIFLYPENWLVESQRPNRTEIFDTLDQETRQGEATADYLESVLANYLERLDEIAHLTVTGTCVEATGTVHVIARTPANPPRYYYRAFADRVWSGWQQIPLDIKAQQAVPAVYRNRVCLFWVDIAVSNEPRQQLSPMQASPHPPTQDVARFVSIGLNFSSFRNGSWAPAQKSNGKLFDVPLLSTDAVSTATAIESLYTLKVRSPVAAAGFGASLLIDVFRLGGYLVIPGFLSGAMSVPNAPLDAVHVGRAPFDGRFGDLEQRNLVVNVNGVSVGLLDHAQSAYGPDALTLAPLTDPDPDLVGEPGLAPRAGALVTVSPAMPQPLRLVSTTALWSTGGVLLNTPLSPFRLVGKAADLALDSASPFFYQDSSRCYFIEGAPRYGLGMPIEFDYQFGRFYHPYTRLLWHQLEGAGVSAMFDRDLQLGPDAVDPSGADRFSFNATYNPRVSRVSWGEDNEILDFTPSAAYANYNWELFVHAPLCIADRLSQDQQFEDALTWYQFLFDPTRQGSGIGTARFWSPQPFATRTAAAILAERINELLALVNQHDPDADAQVAAWRRHPFDPFLLADQRPVAYMKRIVMSYLDNLLAWADNLFSTDSREALNEATLLYVRAAEILGPEPVAVTPAPHSDEAFVDLEPQLDAFANALVDIENVVPVGGGVAPGGVPLPAPQTFYFKVPPNQQLLEYWATVAERLFKLRHCQNRAGATRELALFDGSYDPGLLVRAQAAGVDLSSVLSMTSAPRPGYRFATLYAQALDFCNAVTTYGAEMQAALEKKDASALALLLAGQQQQVESDAGQVLQRQIDAATQDLAALQQALAVAQAQQRFAAQRPWANAEEATAVALKIASLVPLAVTGVIKATAALAHPLPTASAGVAGVCGTPTAGVSDGGPNAGQSADSAADAFEKLADGLDRGSDLAKMLGDFEERAEQNAEKALEAQLQIQQVQAQIAAAEIRLDLANLQLANHVTQLNRLQRQIDVLTDMYTSQDLYDWMIGRLADTYFQSYRLAYGLCQQAEQCYRYELGLPASGYIQFGYWDSLKRGLQAGESLVHDLRRMQAAYLTQNSRRFEVGRYIPLSTLDPQALLTLVRTGTCSFELPESLFDSDYPGHYQRRLQRVSVTVAYPGRGAFDNISGTLTLTRNSVRTSSDLSSPYRRTGPADTRFVDQFGAVEQKIALTNGQDDPGLFLTTLGDNLADPRYLPFEGAGATSSWRLDLPASANDIDLGRVTDVVLHVYYTALDGGDTFGQAVAADVATHQPTGGMLLVSASGSPTTSWQHFLSTSGPDDQVLTIDVSAGQFPRWSRGKTVTVSALTVLATSPRPGEFVLAPQAPLAESRLTMTTVTGAAEPTVVSATLGTAPSSLGPWSFKLRRADAGDFHSLTASDISDVVLAIAYRAS